jgi:hypothetical protein
MGVKPYKFDGVVFVDLDKFTTIPELKGKQHEIFNRFHELTDILDHLLSMKYSPSGNLHAFFYHTTIKDEKEYDELAGLDMALLAYAIKRLIGLDLRDFDGALDAHQKHYQKLNVNDSKVQWNIYCNPVSLDKKDITRLKNEYSMCFKGLTDRRISGVNSTTISEDGDTRVDKDYYILGWNGYDARTVIASAAYIHFKKDIDITREWLSKTFSNANEINSQLESMIRNGKVEGKFHPQVEEYLFGRSSVINTTDSKPVILNDGEYLSDKIDIDQLHDKWYYIVSNTNTGKTEFVKGIMTNPDVDKIVLVQMNQALRDGKKHGIEEFTRDNFIWDTSLSKDKVHTTVEGFVRNMNDVDLRDYIVVVDEAHLLQDYSSMKGKVDVHRILLQMIETARQVIFMSATPKNEMNLFPFTVLEFIKRQPQLLEIVKHPIKYHGRGSKENARYTFMNKIILEQSKKTKCLVFSNKNYNKWHSYGMKNTDYKLFHSRNKGEEWVECVLNDNTTSSDITLATIYLGVGVEIKKENEVHIFFDLDEGWDMDFIIQTLGRPRDAEKLVLHWFYTDKVITNDKTFDLEDKKSILSTAFRHLVIQNENTDEPLLNLLAARMTGVYDSLFKQYNGNDKVEALIISQIISNYCNVTVYDMDLLLKRVLYKNVCVRENDVEELLTKGKKRIKTEETTLYDILCSKSDNWWRDIIVNMERFENVLAGPDMVYDNKVNAFNTLKQCKWIWNEGFNLQQVRDYFETISTAERIIGYLSKYCKVKAGNVSVCSFDGSETIKERLEKEFSIVEKVFTQEYIDYRIEKIVNRHPMREYPLGPPILDEIFKEVIGLDERETLEEYVPYPFNGTSYKECLKKDKQELSELNGKIGGKTSSPKKEVILKNSRSEEVKKFDSKESCMKFLKISPATFSKYLKVGHTKKVVDWIPIMIGGKPMQYAG